MAASAQISVGLSTADYERAKTLLDGVGANVNAILASAVNEALRYTKNQVFPKALKDVLDLKNATQEIKSRITTPKLASKSDPSGILQIDHQAIPLNRFNITFGSGVTATPIKGLPPLNFARAFQHGRTNPVFRTIPGSQKTVPSKGAYAGRKLTRKTPYGNVGDPLRRRPTEKLFGTSVVAAVELSPGLEQAAIEATQQKLEDRVESKIDWKLAGKSGLPGEQG